MSDATRSEQRVQRAALQRVLDAEKAVERSKKAQHAAVKRAYPVGTLVRWTHGPRVIEAEVTGHRDYWWVKPELVVASLSTGKEYTVCAWRVWNYESGDK